MSFIADGIAKLTEPVSDKTTTAAEADKEQKLGVATNLTVIDVYTPEATRWYMSLPYGFVFQPKDKSAAPFEFWLPISPQNLNITTHYATNVVTTLYGVVEEHSPIRYYDITIRGTTGYTAEYNVAFFDDHIDKEGGIEYSFSKNDAPIQSGRSSVEPAFAFDDAAGGFFSRNLSQLQNALGQADSLVDSINGKDRWSPGLNIYNSGYMAFHNFYRFLHKYKTMTSNDEEQPEDYHPLVFKNYKDGNRYDVVPIRFDMVRSANNPMLYEYTIQMRAYKMRPMDLSSKEVNELTLDNMGLTKNGEPINKPSAFSKIANGAKTAKAAISGLTSAAAVF
jgi:hypothetical protein